MTIIRNYNFDTTKITALAVDSSNGEFIWIGFAKNASNVCILQKVSAHDLSQVYYEMELPVDEISFIHIFGSYLYVAVDDSIYLYYKISLSSPLTIQTGVAIPSGINEVPLSILDDDTYIYILTPGIAIGENAKIIKFSSALVFQETIDLGETNSVGFTISGTDIWVVTSSSPSKLIRVYQLSGGIYTTDTTILS